jgi:hypothetical protein
VPLGVDKFVLIGNTHNHRVIASVARYGDDGAKLLSLTL